MQKFFVLLQKELIENWKTRKLILILMIGIILGMFIPFYADVTYHNDPLVSPLKSSHILYDFIQWLSYILAILIPFALMSSVAKEVKDGLTAAILVKPAGRSAYILSKFVVSYLIFALAVTIGFAICYIYAINTTKPFDPTPVSSGIFFQSLGFLLLYTAFAVALTIFLSSVFNNNVLAGGIAVVALIAIFGFSFTDPFRLYMPSEIVRWSMELVCPDWFQGFIYDYAKPVNPYWWALGINIGAIPALIGGSIFLINKKEI